MAQQEMELEPWKVSHRQYLVLNYLIKFNFLIIHCSFFFPHLFLAAFQHMEFLGQGSYPSQSCDLHCSYGNTGSLTHCAGGSTLCPSAPKMPPIPLCHSGNSSMQFNTEYVISCTQRASKLTVFIPNVFWFLSQLLSLSLLELIIKHPERKYMI